MIFPIRQVSHSATSYECKITIWRSTSSSITDGKTVDSHVESVEIRFQTRPPFGPRVLQIDRRFSTETTLYVYIYTRIPYRIVFYTRYTVYTIPLVFDELLLFTLPPGRARQSGYVMFQRTNGAPRPTPWCLCFTADTGCQTTWNVTKIYRTYIFRSM